MSQHQPGSSCKDAAQQLALCVEKSQCVKEGGSIMDCMKKGDIGTCEGLRNAYFECRRSQLDMRTRIRGKRFHETATDE